MKSRKRFASWLSATLIGTLAVAAAPLLFGGGGDEGVDILPLKGELTLQSTRSFGASGAPGGIATVDVGCVRVDLVSGLVMDDLGNPRHSGVMVGQGSLGGTGGTTLGGGGVGGAILTGQPTVEVLAKGGRHLSFARPGGLVHVDGRFEMTDYKANDTQPLPLIGHWHEKAIVVVMIGVRSTHVGAIPASFSSVDKVMMSVSYTGFVDLRQVRAQAIAQGAGTGRDVAVGLLVGNTSNLVQSWAAFNVDDASAVYDVDAKGH
ncbi:MAG TPA: hypothetical protein VFG37_13060 [Planctomycetota bacterium]|jgi:hypothetical protein|nr:hypothetical protein [Planctomycetota bacterium]